MKPPKEEAEIIMENLSQKGFIERGVGVDGINRWKINQIPIVIYSAKYGSSNHSVDVTDKINHLLSLGITEGSVSPAFLAGSDPDIGVVKILNISCMIRGRQRRLSFSDGEKFVIK